MSTILETDRLLLRQLTWDDLDPLAEAYADPETMRYIGAGEVRSREETAASLERMVAGYAQWGYGLWATIYKPEGIWVGRCGIIRWEIEGQEELEVGYLIARPHWGRGLATEAARAIRDWGLRELRRERLISLIYPDNRRSIAVAEKIGMAYERPVELFGNQVSMYSLHVPRQPKPRA
ncbi:MAG TPA: GNAT family N-acetyltransferase [bacterium]|nr:GNAT family N-acetyltransferase [bacterium]